MPTAADGSDGGHRAVPCSEIILDIDAVGPRVTFGDVRLQPGEFLVGGYSNFLFSFKEMNAAPMENAITLLAPYCDAEATTRDARELALLAPTFMLGWNPNKHLKLLRRALRSSTWSSTASSPRLTPTTSASPSHRGRRTSKLRQHGRVRRHRSGPLRRHCRSRRVRGSMRGVRVALPAPTFKRWDGQRPSSKTHVRGRGRGHGGGWTSNPFRRRTFDALPRMLPRRRSG